MAKAGTQELFLGLLLGYFGPRPWVILCCRPMPLAGSWIGFVEQLGLELAPHMEWRLCRWSISVLCYQVRDKGKMSEINVSVFPTVLGWWGEVGGVGGIYFCFCQLHHCLGTEMETRWVLWYCLGEPDVGRNVPWVGLIVLKSCFVSGPLVVLVYFSVPTDLSTDCRAWPEVLFNLSCLASLDEVLRVFCCLDELAHCLSGSSGYAFHSCIRVSS